MIKRTAMIFLLLLPTYSWDEELVPKCIVDAVISLTRDKILQEELIKYNKNNSNPMLVEKIWAELSPDSPIVTHIIQNPASLLSNKLIA